VPVTIKIAAVLLRLAGLELSPVAAAITGFTALRPCRLRYRASLSSGGAVAWRERRSGDILLPLLGVSRSARSAAPPSRSPRSLLGRRRINRQVRNGSIRSWLMDLGFMKCEHVTSPSMHYWNEWAKWFCEEAQARQLNDYTWFFILPLMME
jgi:hypothetical protein